MTWDEVMENIHLQAEAENRSVVEVMRDHRDACDTILANVTAPNELREVVTQQRVLLDYTLVVMGEKP